MHDCFVTFEVLRVLFSGSWGITVDGSRNPSTPNIGSTDQKCSTRWVFQKSRETPRKIPVNEFES